MKHDKYIEYTLHTGVFSDVAGSREAARRKAEGWKVLGIELTGIDKTVRERSSGRVINTVCIHIREGVEV